MNDNIDLSDWWNPIGNIMKNRLENSQLIEKRIKSYIGKLACGFYSRN